MHSLSGPQGEISDHNVNALLPMYCIIIILDYFLIMLLKRIHLQIENAMHLPYCCKIQCNQLSHTDGKWQVARM